MFGTFSFEKKVQQKEKHCNGIGSFGKWVLGCFKSTTYGTVRGILLAWYGPSWRLSINTEGKP